MREQYSLPRHVFPSNRETSCWSRLPNSTSSLTSRLSELAEVNAHSLRVPAAKKLLKGRESPQLATVWVLNAPGQVVLVKQADELEGGSCAAVTKKYLLTVFFAQLLCR